MLPELTEKDKNTLEKRLERRGKTLQDFEEDYTAKWSSAGMIGVYDKDDLLPSTDPVVPKEPWEKSVSDQLAGSR